MPTQILMAIHIADQLRMLLGFLLLCLVPFATFSENPGMTPSGWAQLVAITVTVIGASIWIRRKTILGRLGIAVVAYMIATFLSNWIAMALIPHLVH